MPFTNVLQNMGANLNKKSLHRGL